MMTVSVHEAKTHLSSILLEVERFGEPVVICRYNRAVAQIVPFKHGDRVTPDPDLSAIKIKCDLTEETGGEWDDA